MNKDNKKLNKLGPIVTDSSSNLDQPETAHFDRRVTRRTVKLATQVTPEFKRLLKQLAFEQDCMLIEIIERAVYNYAKQKLEASSN